MLAGEEVVRGLNIVILVGRLFRALTIGWLALSAGSRRSAGGRTLTLNARFRKTLGWKTPAEALDQCLAEIDKHRVATTG